MRAKIPDNIVERVFSIIDTEGYREIPDFSEDNMRISRVRKRSVSDDQRIRMYTQGLRRDLSLF